MSLHYFSHTANWQSSESGRTVPITVWVAAGAISPGPRGKSQLSNGVPLARERSEHTHMHIHATHTCTLHACVHTTRCMYTHTNMCAHMSVCTNARTPHAHTHTGPWFLINSAKRRAARGLREQRPSLALSKAQGAPMVPRAFAGVHYHCFLCPPQKGSFLCPERAPTLTFCTWPRSYCSTASQA